MTYTRKQVWMFVAIVLITIMALSTVALNGYCSESEITRSPITGPI